MMTATQQLEIWAAATNDEVFVGLEGRETGRIFVGSRLGLALIIHRTYKPYAARVHFDFT
jgi:hypothetical protein